MRLSTRAFDLRGIGMQLALSLFCGFPFSPLFPNVSSLLRERNVPSRHPHPFNVQGARAASVKREAEPILATARSLHALSSAAP